MGSTEDVAVGKEVWICYYVAALRTGLRNWFWGNRKSRECLWAAYLVLAGLACG